MNCVLAAEQYQAQASKNVKVKQDSSSSLEVNIGSSESNRSVSSYNSIFKNLDEAVADAEGDQIIDYSILNLKSTEQMKTERASSLMTIGRATDDREPMTDAEVKNFRDDTSTLDDENETSRNAEESLKASKRSNCSNLSNRKMPGSSRQSSARNSSRRDLTRHDSNRSLKSFTSSDESSEDRPSNLKKFVVELNIPQANLQKHYDLIEEYESKKSMKNFVSQIDFKFIPYEK